MARDREAMGEDRQREIAETHDLNSFVNLGILLFCFLLVSRLLRVGDLLLHLSFFGRFARMAMRETMRELADFLDVDP